MLFESVFHGLDPLNYDNFAVLRLRMTSPSEPKFLADFVGGEAELWNAAEQGSKQLGSISPDSDLSVKVIFVDSSSVTLYGPKDVHQTLGGGLPTVTSLPLTRDARVLLERNSFGLREELFFKLTRRMA